MAGQSSHYRTSLKKARGLGTAHSGTGHFWFQRTTAVAMIPLCLWLMTQMVGILTTNDRVSVQLWFQNPLNAVFLAVLIVALFWHSKLGLQVIIEDYVHREGTKVALLLFSSAARLLLGLAGIVAIARLHFIGM